MKFKLDRKELEKRQAKEGKTKRMEELKDDRWKKETEGWTDEIANRQKTDRKGRQMEKMMTDGRQKKDTGMDRQNFKQMQDRQEKKRKERKTEGD